MEEILRRVLIRKGRGVGVAGGEGGETQDLMVWRWMELLLNLEKKSGRDSSGFVCYLFLTASFGIL